MRSLFKPIPLDLSLRCAENVLAGLEEKGIIEDDLVL